MDDRPASVYIERTREASYGGEPPFHPSTRHPEYPFADLSPRRNRDYDCVRDLFAHAGLDADRFGKNDWNPLGAWIKPGHTVLVKPNMVMHSHERGRGIECVVTWGSVIRPVIDYAYRALEGRGRIVVADAPLQACDFGMAAERNGCAAVAEFYRRRARIPVEILDLRSASALKDDRGLLRGVAPLRSVPGGIVAVDLGARSCLAVAGDGDARYRVTNYSPRAMRRCHSAGAHRYLVPRAVLEADVIVNMPKPKTHRKAGVSIAMKNLVGAAAEKACLPHHRLGSREEGGDEYLRRNVWKRWATRLQELMDEAAIRGRHGLVPPLRLAWRCADRLVRSGGGDSYREGSWWGNETIGRMICDLNAIFMYADRDGKLADRPRRTQIIVADAIVAGEGEGPLGPDPVPAGFLAWGTSAPAVDAAVSRVMGFDPGKIPHIRDAFSLPIAPAGARAPGEVVIRSNHPAWSGTTVADLLCADALSFRPPEGWAGHIEAGP